MSAVTGLAAALVAGGAALVSAATGGWQPEPALAAAWCLAFAGYVVVFVLHAEVLVPRPLLPDRAAAVLLLVAGLAVWFLAPELNWMATLFVVTAASWTSLAPARAVVAVVAVQSAAVAAGMLLIGADGAGVLGAAGAFASFQAFAVVVVGSAEREGAARAETDRAHAELRAAHEQLRSAHAELRAATALLSAASRDAERLRIARDLHDGVGHQLTALALELEIAGHRATGDGARHVTRAREVAKDLLGEVRATVGALRDEPQRLEQTLRELLGRLPGVQVHLAVDVPEPPGQEVALVLVRAAQEVATNTLRHAAARRLDVTVSQDDDGAVTLRAHDDGRGVPAVVPGHGLQGMVERVRSVGGLVVVDSAPGAGFSVTVHLPAPAHGRGAVVAREQVVT
ncbi:Signal transduction histidine kinase [Georgenia satyanarayanai]|uniref:histidine kinase n=1 Tax=Georgenia satyanarayanai TaxID=860221 RepID=A0A2Y9ASL5_9MICO|nr:histidine kinase [Georgenia satyanarayanai]PYF96334.1 signal transduction histidine kinase [Georgenia satyanarayanai]SSA47056.1 Signal transduction histidine kinase [Georgenia satyanarayanai]